MDLLSIVHKASKIMVRNYLISPVLRNGILDGVCKAKEYGVPLE